MHTRVTNFSKGGTVGAPRCTGSGRLWLVHQVCAPRSPTSCADESVAMRGNPPHLCACGFFFSGLLVKKMKSVECEHSILFSNKLWLLVPATVHPGKSEKNKLVKALQLGNAFQLWPVCSFRFAFSTCRFNCVSGVFASSTRRECGCRRRYRLQWQGD